MFRVVRSPEGRAVLQAADDFTARRMREKGYRVGDLLAAQVTKPRSPGYHAYAHRLGQMVADNIEGFEGMQAHKVLKRLQLESGVECESAAIKVPGLGMVEHRIPKSMAFESMDDGAFREMIMALCQHLVREYWPSETPEHVAELARALPEAV
ncbi:hypothetical protein [Alcanivorax jadensis]|uniref:hypothetical protein n=1 Tax=Alcanivorax jadensis TaxID=64988 RepID=UPI0023528C5C|nr:hypothetical protein [Alcanivorax jadensis]